VAVSIFRLTKSQQAIESPAISVQQETQGAKLTEAEERDLEKLTPQTLLWISTWIQPTNCLVNENIQEPDFRETLKRYEGKEIEMRLEVHERSLVVSFDSLHTFLSFARLQKSGLAPAEYHLFCENSYKEYKTEISRLHDMNHPPSEEMLKQQSSRHPNSAEVMDGIRRMYSSPTEDQVLGEETRRYRVRQRTDSRANKLGNWSDEKRALYDHILDVIRNQEKLSCAPAETVEVTIPNFDLGDPAIYVLLNGAFYGGGDYIEWIDFERDPSTGEYSAQHLKSFGLPDEVQPLATLIQTRQIRHLKLGCSE
jgi:hypothetical protein